MKLRGFADLKESNENIYKDKLLTFKWAGFEQSDEVLCFYKINTSKTWDDFKNGLKDLSVPAMNFMYADIEGNIGYHAAGKIPIRKTSDFKITSPLSATLTDGFINFDDLPSQFNPQEDSL
jgi:penicillin amidase